MNRNPENITILVLIIIVILFAICCTACDFPRTDNEPSGPDPNDFDPFELTVTGDLDPGDVTVEWVETWGSRLGDESVADIAIDNEGNILVVSNFARRPDLDPGHYRYTGNAEGAYDATLGKHDSSGNVLWAITWGEGGYDDANGVLVDSVGNIYVTGTFSGEIDFDPSQDVTESRKADGPQAYLSSFDPDGYFRWVRTWPSLRNCIAVMDHEENIYIAGTWEPELHFRLLKDQQVHIYIDEDIGGHRFYGVSDVLLIKTDPSGNHLWSRSFGGPGYEDVQHLTTDVDGNVYLGGNFFSKRLISTRVLNRIFMYPSKPVLNT